MQRLPKSRLSAPLALSFADDIDLLGGSIDELKVLTNDLVHNAKTMGMEISTGKSKVMINGVSTTNAKIKIDGEELEIVHSFKYLGVMITDDSNSKVEIEKRLILGMSAMNAMNKFWNNKKLNFVLGIQAMPG